MDAISNLASVASRVMIGCSHMQPNHQNKSVKPDSHLMVGWNLEGLNQHWQDGISHQLRHRHVGVLGTTGSGKTTQLLHTAIQDITHNRGVAIIDLKGDLSKSLLQTIPKSRSRDLIYFDATDKHYPPSFNILDNCAHGHSNPDLLAPAIVKGFQSIWGGDSAKGNLGWGPRMEYIFKNTLYALLELNQASLLDIPKLYTNPTYRQYVLKRVTDPVVKTFFKEQFDSLNPRAQLEQTGAIMNKVGQLILHKQLRHILSQKRNRFDLENIMDTNKIFIANLSQAHLGQDASKLLGALLLASFQTAANQRHFKSKNDHPYFTLIVDDFDRITCDAFMDMLADFSSLNIGLHLSTSSLSNLTPRTSETFLTQTHNKLIYKVGREDAELIAPHLDEKFVPNQLMNLRPHEAIMASRAQPFRIDTYAPPELMTRSTKALINHSRSQYAQPYRDAAREVSQSLKFKQAKQPKKKLSTKTKAKKPTKSVVSKFIRPAKKLKRGEKIRTPQEILADFKARHDPQTKS